MCLFFVIYIIYKKSIPKKKPFMFGNLYKLQEAAI